MRDRQKAPRRFPHGAAIGKGRFVMVKITGVEPCSRAEKAGILPGDILLSVNGNEIADVLDYRYYLAEERVTLSVKRGNEEIGVTIKKDMYDDIGLDFETPLMDKKHACANRCIFCFIDQLPDGLRPTLYFKDDDSRLSFLHGNYITLTNLFDKDIDRIIKMRFSPINISVHTTNPELRVRMMKNRRAGEVLDYIRRIAEAGLSIHAQIVLCKGWNDGGELLRTMNDLARYHEAIDSVSVVPAGLTKFRQNLTPLETFSPAECADVIATVRDFGDGMIKKCGRRIFACADEFYVKAGLPLPDASYYEDYPQIENGVGMMTSMKDEFDDALDIAKDTPELHTVSRTVSLATGMAAYRYFTVLSEKVHTAFPKITIHVYGIVNHFFGEEVTVAGLLTGKDYKEQLRDKPLGEALLISKNSARNDEGLFLCGMTVKELEAALGVPVVLVESDGYAVLEAIFGRTI